MSGDRYSYGIPNLINGVSQQAPNFRLPSQCAEQVNGLSSVLDGLSKRPPSETMAKLTSELWDDAFIHVINRDATEQYVVVVRNSTLRVFDLLDGGEEKTVLFPDGNSYLESSSPNENIKMTTVADYTFVVNNSVIIEMDPDEEPELIKNEAIVYIKRGVVNTTYRIMINDSWYQYKTPEVTSTVASVTSGTEEHVLIEPTDWTWTQCYDWLRTNGGADQIQRGMNPWLWTDEERGYFYYRSNGYSITYSATPIIINGCLDISDVELQNQINTGNSATRARATESLNIKTNMRQLVRNRSAELAASGALTGQSTTINNNTQPSTEDIASALVDVMTTSLPDYTIERLGSCIRIYRQDNADFKFNVTDSWGNEGMMGIKKETQKFLDLPARCWDGTRVRIAGEDPSKDDDYYLEYKTQGDTQVGVWQETRGWDQQNYFDNSTMPHTLIRKADGIRSLRQLCG